jgi:hypothetical protein
MAAPRERVIKRRRKRDPTRDLEVAGNSEALEYLPSLQLQDKSNLSAVPARRPLVPRIRNVLVHLVREQLIIVTRGTRC